MNSTYCLPVLRVQNCPSREMHSQLNSTNCLPALQVPSWSCRETHTMTCLPVSEEPLNEETLVSWWLMTKDIALQKGWLQNHSRFPNAATNNSRAHPHRRLLEVAPMSNQCLLKCPTACLDGDVLFCRLRCCNCDATEIQSVPRMFSKTQLAMTSINSFVTTVPCICCLVVTIATMHLVVR